MIEKLIVFTMEQQNTHLSHFAFQGQTPDEMYFGSGKEIPRQLQEVRLAARESRMDAKRAEICRMCEELLTVSS